jgi:hypothetical protein
MKQNYGYVLIVVAIVVAGALGGLVSQTSAAGPAKVYGLYDANNVYLGDIIGVTQGVVGTLNTSPSPGVSYTTYLPSINGILQFSRPSGDLTYAAIPESIMYATADCSGTPYLNADDGAIPWTNPWIIKFDGNTYAIAKTFSSATVGSRYNVVDSTCHIESGGGRLFALTPVTLPFNINAVTLPFSVR